MEDTHRMRSINTKKCIKCGAELNESAKFCSKCGASQIEFNQREYKKEQQKEEYSNRNYINEFSDRNNYGATNNIQKSTGMSKGVIVALIIAGMASALLIIFIIYSSVSRDRDLEERSRAIQEQLDESKRISEENRARDEEEKQRRKEEERDKEISDLKTKLESESRNNNSIQSQTKPTQTRGTDPTYIMESSNSVLIEIHEINHMSKDDLEYIRNEIYARKGYIFKEPKFKQYFQTKSWYSPNQNFNENMFSPVEKTNIDTIVAYEKSMGWR